MSAVAQWYQSSREAVARTLNWTGPLNGATISAVAWSVPSAVTTEATSNTSTSASIRLSGGVGGSLYTIRCLVTSSSSEDLEAEVELEIAQ